VDCGQLPSHPPKPTPDHTSRSHHDIAASHDSESVDDSASDRWKGDSKFKDDSKSCLGKGNAKSKDNSEGTLEMGDGERSMGMGDSRVNDDSEIDCSPGKEGSDLTLGSDSKRVLGKGDSGRGLGSSGSSNTSDDSEIDCSLGSGGSESRLDK